MSTHVISINRHLILRHLNSQTPAFFLRHNRTVFNSIETPRVCCQGPPNVRMTFARHRRRIGNLAWQDTGCKSIRQLESSCWPTWCTVRIQTGHSRRRFGGRLLGSVIGQKSGRIVPTVSVGMPILGVFADDRHFG